MFSRIAHLHKNYGIRRMEKSRQEKNPKDLIHKLSRLHEEQTGERPHDKTMGTDRRDKRKWRPNEHRQYRH